jgi:hypothetical protein
MLIKKKVRILVHVQQVTAPVVCQKFDIRIPEGVKRIRAITVTTNL